MPVEEYEDRVRKAIEKAIRTAGDGRSASAFAKRMRAEVGNGPGLSAPARWIRSDEGHERIPAWALLAAADVAGVSVAELLEDQASGGANVSALASAVTEQSRQLAGVIRELEQQGRMLAHMRSALSEQGIQLPDQAGGREADAL